MPSCGRYWNDVQQSPSQRSVSGRTFVLARGGTPVTELQRRVQLFAALLTAARAVPEAVVVPRGQPVGVEGGEGRHQQHRKHHLDGEGAGAGNEADGRGDRGGVREVDASGVGDDDERPDPEAGSQDGPEPLPEVEVPESGLKERQQRGHQGPFLGLLAHPRSLLHDPPSRP